MQAFISTVLIFLTLGTDIALGQPDSPVFAGPVISFLPPAVDATGRTIALGSTVTPKGDVQNAADLYVGSAKLASNITSVGLTSDGLRAVVTDVVSGGEGVRMVDTATGALRTLNVDKQGCIRPAAVCPACFFACVVTPHATPDGDKVLYAVRRNQPFIVVNADGTRLTQLPVYSGALAPAPQRVISGNGLVVFTSSAPFGPTFAASATDIYVMNLDGTNIRNLTKFGNNSAIFSSDATISTDGNTIVFVTNYTGNAFPPAQETQIWAVQSDGTGLRRKSFGRGSATSPSISADGKTGAFVQGGLVNVLEPFAELDGVNVAIGALYHSVAQSCVISDDGTRVAFLIGPRDASPGAVYQINQDGSGLRAVYAPRAINPRGVVSAAGLGLPPSPGGLISVYGINFTGDSITTAAAFPLPDSLAGASVLLNRTKLPILSASPWQMNAQLPQETLAQTANFQVEFGDGIVTPPEEASIAAAAPELFVIQEQRGDTSVFQAAALHAGTAILADDDHPAHSGEALELYGTGLGATDPPVPAGQPSPTDPLARARLMPVVLIGDLKAQVLFAGLTPGFAGVYQVNVIVPDRLKPGQYHVELKSGEASMGGLGTIAVQ